MTRFRLLLAGLVAGLFSPSPPTPRRCPISAAGPSSSSPKTPIRRCSSSIPKTGKQIGWEYDAMNEIAKRLNFKVELPEHLLGRDDPGRLRRPVRHRHDRHHHQGRPQGEGRFLRSLHALGAVHAGARRRDPLHRRQDASPTFKDGLVGAQAGTTPFYTAVYSVLDGNEANPRIKLFETFGATVQALKAGDVDIVLTDGTAGKGYVDASDGELKLIGGPLGTEDFGFIFKKGSDLVAPVNAAIAAMKADGTHRRAQQEVVPRLQVRASERAGGSAVTVRTPGQVTALTDLAATQSEFPWWLVAAAALAVAAAFAIAASDLYSQVFAIVSKGIGDHRLRHASSPSRSPRRSASASR